MKRFYAELKRGRSKDAALRAAQRAMLQSPATAHPYRWAAFQLAGDWR
jgi:CHAT domain-containing protein